MAKEVTFYVHHDCLNAVATELKGKHREHCLCYQCGLFKPDDRAKNCTLANLVYAICEETGMVLPVWECPSYLVVEEKNDAS